MREWVLYSFSFELNSGHQRSWIHFWVGKRSWKAAACLSVSVSGLPGSMHATLVETHVLECESRLHLSGLEKLPSGVLAGDRCQLAEHFATVPGTAGWGSSVLQNNCRVTCNVIVISQRYASERSQRRIMRIIILSSFTALHIAPWCDLVALVRWMFCLNSEKDCIWMVNSMICVFCLRMCLGW